MAAMAGQIVAGAAVLNRAVMVTAATVVDTSRAAGRAQPWKPTPTRRYRSSAVRAISVQFPISASGSAAAWAGVRKVDPGAVTTGAVIPGGANAASGRIGAVSGSATDPGTVVPTAPGGPCCPGVVVEAGTDGPERADAVVDAHPDTRTSPMAITAAGVAGDGRRLRAPVTGAVRPCR